MTTKEHLEKARALLVEKGWIQGIGQRNGSYCMLGALGAARGIDIRTWASAFLALDAAILDPVNDIPTWNDAPERTLEDVLAAFDRAIASCD